MVNEGSPPHTRGKADPAYRCVDGLRITPAYAGKSSRSSLSVSHGRDHPRIRGEKVTVICMVLFSLGSPPHTWGKDILRRQPRLAAGITPAYAGKRIRGTSPQPVAWEHPRIRGEKSRLNGSTSSMAGSPPHMRGKVLLGRRRHGRKGITPHTRGKEIVSGFEVSCHGITPAYAGKSGWAGSPSPPARDHPRIRGEKSVGPFPGSAARGSPPHTRGKEALAQVGHARHGITPAYAGKSRCTTHTGFPPRDHPRIRGEKMDGLAEALRELGSPPHTRGKALQYIRQFIHTGISPAYAGKSWPRPCRFRSRRDHPRMRGEKPQLTAFLMFSGGSPPHARGKVPDPVQLGQIDRITPACAGKSERPCSC